MRRCEACERGEHWNCGMQTWCECECDGPDGVYADGDAEDDTDDPLRDEIVSDCGDPDCCMIGPHFRSECYDPVMMEDYQREVSMTRSQRHRARRRLDRRTKRADTAWCARKRSRGIWSAKYPRHRQLTKAIRRERREQPRRAYCQYCGQRVIRLDPANKYYCPAGTDYYGEYCDEIVVCNTCGEEMDDHFEKMALEEEAAQCANSN